jgi:hypothetical protein
VFQFIVKGVERPFSKTCGGYVDFFLATYRQPAPLDHIYIGSRGFNGATTICEPAHVAASY